MRFTRESDLCLVARKPSPGPELQGVVIQFNVDGVLLCSRHFSHDKNAVALVEDVQDRLDRFRNQ